MHPAFHEAVAIRAGVRSMPPHHVDRAWAMIELTGDQDGEIAQGLIWLYQAEANAMEALTVAFLAGLLIGRDG